MNRDDVPFSMFGHLPKEAEESSQNENARLRADLAAMTAERDAMRNENESLVMNGYDNLLRIETKRTYKKLRAELKAMRERAEAAEEQLRGNAVFMAVHGVGGYALMESGPVEKEGA